jgi:hypothetical protein
VALAESLLPAAVVLPLALMEGSTEQVQVEAGLTVAPVAPVAGLLLSAAAVLPVVLPVALAAVVLPVLPAPSLTTRSSQGPLRTRIKRRTLSSSYAKLQARGS